MARRMIGVFVGSVALATCLSGCLFAYDAAPKEVTFKNSFGQDVVVYEERSDGDFGTSVPSGESNWASLDECEGNAFRVETASGELIGRVDEQACPNWTLTINEDGTLDYVKDE